MAERPTSQVRITVFQGLVRNMDPNDLQSGQATEQKNFECRIPGQLTSRKGLQVVSFEN